MRISLQAVGSQAAPARQFTQAVIRVGRDPANDLVLEDATHAGVSRHHAELRHADGAWRLVDLGSTNGSYLNGRRVTDAVLSDGDEIQFSSRGPRVRILLPRELVRGGASAAPVAPPERAGVVAQRPVAERPTPRAVESNRRDHAGNAPPRGPGELTESELLPLRMGRAPLMAKGFLLQGLITFVAVFGFFVASQTGELDTGFTLLQLYLTAASVYVVYLMCGKRKPWWLFVGAAAATAIIAYVAATRGPLAVIAGMAPAEWKNSGFFPTAFLFHLVGAALPEEAIKIAPVLLLVYWGLQNRGSDAAAHLEVREPLDGILLGVASAGGFTALEALFKYIPGAIEQGAAQENLAAGVLAAVGQLILRSIGTTFMHAAWSGIFGYYVGLASLRPARRWELLVRGYLMASLVHALWNSSPALHPLLLVPVGMAGYAALVASIIQARKISPTRALNFATNLGRTS